MSDSLFKKLIPYWPWIVVGIIIVIITIVVVTTSSKSAFDISIYNSQNSSSQTLPPITTVPPYTGEPPTPTNAPTPSPTTLPLPPTTSSPSDTLPPLKFIEPYCIKPGSILDSSTNKCVYYPENGSEDLEIIFNNLNEQNRIIETSEGLIVRDENLIGTPTKTEDEPFWYSYWIKQGKYNANKLLSGENLFGEGINCSCGDCAGWRGGNAGTCAGYDIPGRPKSNIRRVACDASYDPDRCVCAYPFTPINGLCVIPYKFNDQTNKPCCSSCVYDNTCPGKEECEGECEENVVEYPGIKYVCNDQFSSTSDTGNKIIATQTEIDTNCSVTGSKYNRMNEYQCALECIDTGPKCSQRCLPKLWKWKELYDDQDELKGYIQTDELIQFESPTTTIDYCDSNCRDKTQNVSNPSQKVNCSECENCVWKLNTVLGEYEKVCEKCKWCKNFEEVSINPNESRNLNVLNCENVLECRGCQDSFDPTKSISTQTICDYCTGTAEGNCHVNEYADNYQRQPNNTFVEYNKGDNYHPEEISIYQDWYRFSEGASSAICKAFTDSSTCESNYGNLDKGYAEGGALGFTNVFNRDCTGIGSCRMYKSYMNPTYPECYSGQYYGQMGQIQECQELPLANDSESVLPEDLDKIPLSQKVKWGVAGDYNKELCEKFFCNRYNFSNSRWESSPTKECEAICQPEKFEGYDQIPAFYTSNDQVDFLLKN